jgi:hypothetical protein
MHIFFSFSLFYKGYITMNGRLLTRIQTKMKTGVAAVLICVSTPLLQEKEPASSTMKIPISDPNRAATLKVNMLYGSIIVKAAKTKDASKEILVQTQPSAERTSKGGSSWSWSWKGKDKEKDKESMTQGLKLIPNAGLDISAEEEDNVVTIQGSHRRQYDVVVQVPANTALKLKAVNNGNIEVEGTSGEIEAENINGAISLKQVSGAVTAHALNGGLKAVFSSFPQNKPMSLSSMNGAVDVTIPASAKATFLLKTQQGEIYSDFDLKMESSAPKIEEKKDGGKYRVKFDNFMRASINGGGTEIQLKNFNGDIYLRSAK